jgi:hypothetical protein
VVFSYYNPRFLLSIHPPHIMGERGIDPPRKMGCASYNRAPTRIYHGCRCVLHAPNKATLFTHRAARRRRHHPRAAHRRTSVQTNNHPNKQTNNQPTKQTHNGPDRHTVQLSSMYTYPPGSYFIIIFYCLLLLLCVCLIGERDRTNP